MAGQEKLNDENEMVSTVTTGAARGAMSETAILSRGVLTHPAMLTASTNQTEGADTPMIVKVYPVATGAPPVRALYHL
jgi:hypothetical protein